MKLISFLQETKKEALKVTWLKRKDLILSTLSVFLIVGLFSVFFLVADLLISKFITYIIGVSN
ncbi:MAG: preprotein translocase subunit SecE [Alphaproteobacteria bacterium]|nr:preprotein translocase subunit SecE [Alphaproteobacteria bacterium]